MATLPKHCTTK